jgi:hypothetical protein
MALCRGVVESELGNEPDHLVPGRSSDELPEDHN